MLQEDGSYHGFDDQEFTSKSGGKAKAVKSIKVSIIFNKFLMHH